MKKSTYCVICIILTLLSYRIWVLDRLSDIHAITMGVMLDTSERLVGEVNFLIGLVDEEELLEALDEKVYKVTGTYSSDYESSAYVEYPKYIPEETKLAGRPITEETVWMTEGELLQYWKKYDQTVKEK